MTEKESSAPADPRAHVPRMTVEPRKGGSRIVTAEEVAAETEAAAVEAKRRTAELPATTTTEEVGNVS